MKTDFELFGDVIMAGNWVVLDTATTGLLPYGEVCQVGVVGAHGDTLINSLVRPVLPISDEATHIHGITQDMVAYAPHYAEIAMLLAPALRDKDLIIYNAASNWKILGRSAQLQAPRIDFPLLKPRSIHCAMLWYADVWGEWDDYHGNNRWQRLGVACAQQNIPTGALHGALADAQATRHLILTVLSKSGYDINHFLQF